MQTKVYHKGFYSVIKEMPLNPLKVAAAKKYFPSVYVNTSFWKKVRILYLLSP